MDPDFATPTPFTAGVAIEKLCSEIYCGNGADEVVVSNIIPVVIAGIFAIPVLVVFIKMLMGGKKGEPTLLEKQASTNNIVILLLLSLVIAGGMFLLFFFL